jgi:hypothetical protein
MPKIMRLTSILLLGHNGDSRPHSPQSLIFCGVRRTISQNRQAPSSPDGCGMAMTVIFCVIPLGRRSRTIEPRPRQSDRGPQWKSRRVGDGGHKALAIFDAEQCSGAFRDFRNRATGWGSALSGRATRLIDAPFPATPRVFAGLVRAVARDTHDRSDARLIEYNDHCRQSMQV